MGCLRYGSDRDTPYLWVWIFNHNCIRANIEARGKLMCKSNLFKSYKGNSNKDLRGRVTLGEEQADGK